MTNLFKKYSLVLVWLVCVCGTSNAAKSDKVTLLVVPAHYSVIQVAMDVHRFYPTILVSYQAGEDGDDPVLYAWNGRGEWVYVSCEDYLSGRFFSRPPARAVLVGSEDNLPPLLADGPLWVKKVVKVPTMKTPELLNSLGKVYDFDAYTWKWFAKRFNLEVVDVNAPARQTSWYDGTYVEKQMPDGTVQKVYIAPDGSMESQTDLEIIEVNRVKGAAGIPLKAEPPRMAEEIYIDAEEIEPGEYELEDVDIETTSWESNRGDKVTVIDVDVQQKAFDVTPTPAPPAKEQSVFFEYTEEDMKAMGTSK